MYRRYNWLKMKLEAICDLLNDSDLEDKFPMGPTTWRYLRLRFVVLLVSCKAEEVFSPIGKVEKENGAMAFNSDKVNATLMVHTNGCNFKPSPFYTYESDKSKAQNADGVHIN